MNKPLRALITTLCLAMLVSLAYAERCEMIGGCVGEVWYIHVPKGQRTTAIIFSLAGLPKVNAVRELITPVSLLDDSTLSSEHYRAQLVRDLKKAASANMSLEGWGMTLQHGSRVTILSYKTFPQLGEMAGEKFVKVLVRSDGET